MAWVGMSASASELCDSGQATLYLRLQFGGRGGVERAASFVPAVEIKSGVQAKLLAHVPRNGALVMMTVNIPFLLGVEYLQLLFTPSPRKRVVFIKKLSSAPKQV